jgi:hypothetical protein
MNKKQFYEKLGYAYVSLSVKLSKLSLFPKLAVKLLDKGSTYYIHGASKPSICQKPGLKEEWIYSWRFHFNPYTEQWNVYHIDDAREYANGKKTKHPVIKTSTFEGAITTLLIIHNKDHKNLYGC